MHTAWQETKTQDWCRAGHQRDHSACATRVTAGRCAGVDASLQDIQARVQAEQATMATVVNVLDLAVRRLQVLMAEHEVRCVCCVRWVCPADWERGVHPCLHSVGTAAGLRLCWVSASLLAARLLTSC